MSGDPEALAYMKRTCDRVLQLGGRVGGNTCCAMSYLYRHFRDKRYLDSALLQLPRRSRFSNPWKDFALSMRNAALCIGDLTKLQRKKEKKQGSPYLSDLKAASKARRFRYKAFLWGFT